MLKILQAHLLRAFVANSIIDGIYALYPESFCNKNLAVRKVFAFSDSAADVLPYIELVMTNTQLANQRLGSWCPWLNGDWFEVSLPSWAHEYILHFSFLIMHFDRHQWETRFLLALPELLVQHWLLFSTNVVFDLSSVWEKYLFRTVAFRICQWSSTNAKMRKMNSRVRNMPRYSFICFFSTFSDKNFLNYF